MRVIVFLNSLYTGGAEFSTLLFYSWLLKQKDYDVKLVCYKNADPSYSCRDFGFEKEIILEGNSFFKKLSSFNILIREFKPHLVHSVLFQANIVGRFSRFFNSFIHLESLVNETYSPNRLLDPQVTRSKLAAYRLFDFLTQLGGVDHFHANGKSVSQHYRKKLKIGMHRMTIIPRGRSANPFVGDLVMREKIRAELKTGNRLLMINVARHEYQKGQDVLLEALTKLTQKIENLQVILVGREGKLTEHVVKSIKDFDLTSSVLLLGHRNDISQLLASADIFVFTSRFEGLPGALIEAEAAGLPIVCSDIPNNREVAHEGRNALFFTPNDSNQLARRIEEIISAVEQRYAMGLESKKIFLEGFSLQNVHERMLNLLLELTRKK